MEVLVTTKDKIVMEALRLFSSKGYDGVSMREIAAAVGIKGASLYNHFSGKEDIFNAIFTEMTRQYDAAAIKMNIPVAVEQQAIRLYHDTNEDRLLHMAEGLFDFFTQNEFAALFRKLLVSEQHKSTLAARYLREYYLEAPVLFQSQIFIGLQQKGDFQGYDAEIMALHFYSPIYYTLSRFDLGDTYDACFLRLRRHIHSFCEFYKK